MKCTKEWCIVSYYDVKAACAALVYFSGRKLTANDKSYNLDIRFANDTKHIVWDKEYVRNYKQKQLEKRCFHLAYVLDLLEKEVYTGGEPRNSDVLPKKQIEAVALDLETRLVKISHTIESVKQQQQEKIVTDIETNEAKLNNTIRDLQMKNEYAQNQVQQVKSDLHGVKE